MKSFGAREMDQIFPSTLSALCALTVISRKSRKSKAWELSLMQSPRLFELDVASSDASFFAYEVGPLVSVLSSNFLFLLTLAEVPESPVGQMCLLWGMSCT